MAMRNMIVITVTTTMVMVMISIVGGSASWCVAKIGASEEALQTALDSACEAGGGADCAPIQPDGLCYVPNTLQAHASYAFNSFYQRNTRAPHACLFHGASTIAQTDPSYGSCVYPSSATPSTAGVTNTNTTVTTPAAMPNVAAPTTTTPIHGGDGVGMNPLIPENSTSAPNSNTILTTTSFLVFLLIMSLIP
ncbi:hypothetical protein AAZX31_11G260500 [Glycine max]|uniref:X8 domain-containing protein n=2 Tax=Glycine subgen. Soja TaxID=1462606 RepID=I1LN18_SOYBN|nr:X8 domain-containiong protein precursor [Glycine max]XP_028196474.1 PLASMODESMATA CALLOSE-BINDING PROTEIN 3-like [Glycine soja]KAG4975482.1 hypothetical protein JHK87_032303 [Glycine soja]KAG4995637.1 hypothetical protein JHK86_032464 [Glycine max]KAG5125628.1 hypothetical protein JHK82_032365 [Glycine max]KAG5147064.1 hypothetical protein JHK84_032607 [Glycine max]KAH1160847.1 hypothetical protein GYH30_032220 [Glycine max]|eukprot:NP_001238468.2 X8 domain-containiong protein precursor [Glycine max]